MVPPGAQETNPRLGLPSGLCRERSLRAYDGVVNVAGNANPVVSGFPKPLPAPRCMFKVFSSRSTTPIRLGFPAISEVDVHDPVRRVIFLPPCTYGCTGRMLRIVCIP